MLPQTKLKVAVYVFSLLLVCSLALFSLVKSGSLTPPGTPGATLYTLEDIYQRLVVGTTFTEADHNFGPSAEPTSGTMHTLTDIYGKIPTNDKVLYGTNGGTANTPPGSGTAATSSQITSGYYAFKADGTAIAGSVTPLVWQTDDNSAITYTWENAVTHCTGLVTGGFTWRLPTIGELLKGLSDGFLSPNTSGDGFSSNILYWSSSALSSFPTAKHDGKFTSSTTTVSTNNDLSGCGSCLHPVRCVH